MEKIEYKIDFLKGNYICAKCRKEIKIAPRNHHLEDTSNIGYLGDRGRYNFRGAKANLYRHLKACYKK